VANDLNDLSQYFVTAIIVSHDGSSWLPEVIASLSSQSRPIDRIIAVDTGSQDSSPKLLDAAGITLIHAERDLGYGDAIELALDHCPPIGDSLEECIWLIHDDCAPARDALALLLSALDERPQVVIAGPKLLGWYDRDHLLEAGISIAPNGARWTGLEHREQNQGQHDEIKDVLSVSTAAMLIRRSAFEELGGLDPNLALFRDDVDLGWRARVAGLGAICVGSASAFHAEAAASERRVVDVSEAFLHRPLLLDRRNAAYVVLANSSWWMLPWLTFQILGTTLLRVVFDLLAKLPGYAGDELAAIALVLVKPTDLIKARRTRRKKRLLSPLVAAQFIPPRGSQIRAGLDRFTSTISQKLKGLSDQPVEESVPTYLDMGVLPAEFDEPDFQVTNEPSMLRTLLRRTDSLAVLGIFILSIISARSRFGSLSGGALGFIPASGSDLLRNYAQAWHLVGMGSAVASPPWVAILGISSFISWGHLALFITALFLFTPPLAFIFFVNSLRRIGISQTLSTVGGVIYVLSPLLWSALNQGRIDILVLYLIAPSFIFVKPLMQKINDHTWRRIFAISLLVAVVGSFSPILLAGWITIQIGLLVYGFFQARQPNAEVDGVDGQRDLGRKSAGWIDLLESQNFRPLWRRAVAILTVFLLTLPWSLGALLHPTELLLAPGIPLKNGGTLETLFNNPGGNGAPGWWIIAPIAILLFSSYFVKSLASHTLISSALLAGAMLLNLVHVEGHGGTAEVYVGALYLVISIIQIPPAIKALGEITPTLRSKKLGITHIAIATTVIFSALSTIVFVGWILSTAAPSLVQSDQSDVVPAFVSSLAQSPTKPKTLVISSIGGNTTFFISRGNSLKIGDADVATQTPSEVVDAVNQLLTGSGVTSGRTLGSYGIQYLFVHAPVSRDITRAIDGVGGFARMSATSIGSVWRIVDAAPRVILVGPNNKTTMIPSGDIGASGVVATAGTLTLAEKYDRSWRLLNNGVEVELQHPPSGLPEFGITAPGKVTILYDGTAHRGLISLQLLSLLIAIVMATPSGRRRVEVPLEELV